MTKVPPASGDELTDDVAWLRARGERRLVPAGVPVDADAAVVLVLAGTLAAGDVCVDAGDVAGAAPLLRASAPCAGLIAATDAELLVVPAAAVRERARDVSAFGGRLRRAAQCLAREAGTPASPESKRMFELIEKLLRGEFPRVES